MELSNPSRGDFAALMRRVDSEIKREELRVREEADRASLVFAESVGKPLKLVIGDKKIEAPEAFEGGNEIPDQKDS